ncbi:GNAT family N-acetyltransferase [Maribacter algarum]|uniref:GNAT family N-acetyltransferase n=1 Tax=Maribacter algarum (ex Zhang et al. 2020) TaxID=2578118 RepID=A0A5S3PW47_9FLAO|nr:GNAT family N-acetyltransferase [Maribacter algarum]TMM57218.1 GNAT family N-acetyltransferase [Maribacter algarum]
MEIEVLKASDITTDIQSEVADLYRQLNPHNAQRPLKEILQPDNNVLVIICKMDNSIVGTALLSIYKVISGYRGMVDDVVVDASQRGKGIGRKLMERLLEEGKKMGLDEILLFTGHHRGPAIALYKSLGFEMRKSGLYNLRLN